MKYRKIEMEEVLRENFEEGFQTNQALLKCVTNIRLISGLKQNEIQTRPTPSNNTILKIVISDWALLRKEYRIIGDLIGSCKLLPCLPLKLHIEEVILLLDINVAKVIKRKDSTSIANDHSNETENFAKALFEEEKIVYRKMRREQLDNLKDTIIAAKRKKGDSRSDEDILEDELQKSCQITTENMIWPILNESPILDMGLFEDVSIEDIMRNVSKLKCKVFKDLWNQGYYITSGHKFGGDYLVYLGDPIAYHAIFIVKCIEGNDGPISASEIVAFGRLGTSVKKRAVLASFNRDNEISYITVNWIDS